jgi:hypothetical protein
MNQTEMRDDIARAEPAPTSVEVIRAGVVLALTEDELDYLLVLMQQLRFGLDELDVARVPLAIRAKLTQLKSKQGGRA